MQGERCILQHSHKVMLFSCFTFAFIICFNKWSDSWGSVNNFTCSEFFKDTTWSQLCSRNSPNEAIEIQENAGLIRGTTNTFPPLWSRPTPHAVLKSILEGEPSDPSCEPFSNTRNINFSISALSHWAFERMKKDNKWESRGWIFKKINLEKSITSSITSKLGVLD